MLKRPIFYLLSAAFFQISATSNAQSLDWVHFYEGPNLAGCHISTIDKDGQGNILTSGFFTRTIDFDPGPGVYNITESPSSTPSSGDGFLMQSDTNGNTLWVKAFEGSGSIGAVYTDVDEFGNILLLSYFTDSNDVDPGPGVFYLTGSGRCVIKLDSTGAFLWAKSFADVTGYYRMHKIFAAANGEIIVTGGMNDSLDTDPGPGVFMMVNPSAVRPSGFIIRLNSYGDFINSFFSGNQLDGPEVIIGNSGDMWALGYFWASFDADPGPGTTLLTAFNGNNYLQHLDSAGNFISVLQLEIGLHKLALDSSGGILMAGHFNGQVDVDPGAGTYLINSNGDADICLIRLDSALNFSWAGSFGSNSYEHLFGLMMGSDGSIYLNGGFSYLTDFDPGPGTYEIESLISSGTNYILKLDSAGNFIMVFPLTGTMTNMTFSSMLVFPSGSFYYCDIHRSMEDLDPGMGSLYVSSLYPNYCMIKMKPDSCSLLTFRTEVLSGVGCSVPGNVLCTVMSGSPPFQYLWNNTPPSSDSIAVITTPGQYTVIVSDNTGCSFASTIYVTGPVNTSQPDMEPNMIGSALRINQSTPLLINATNNGCTPVWGSLMLHLDPRAILDSVIPAPAITIGDSLLWFFQAITYDSLPYAVQLFLTPDSTVIIGESLCFTVTTEPPPNEADSSNNSKNYCYPVIGAWDPNLKQAYPVGACDEHFIIPAEEITYTVLFQNTGNDSAHYVMILDTLSPFLELSTLRIDAVSHPVSTHILPGRVLKFEFENIMLPDSGTDLLGSNGYVTFSCIIDSTVPPGTVISNSAIIGFDSNDYVVTDSVYHTITYTIPYPDTSVTVFGTTLTAIQTQATYQWINCTNGGIPIPGATGQTYTALVNGSYAVQIYQNGCTSASSCHNIVSVGLNEISSTNNLLLYPNPANEFVVVESNFKSESLLEVFNVFGELLSTQLFEQHTKLDIDKLAPGLYICRIRNSSEGIVSGYFMKN